MTRDLYFDRLRQIEDLRRDPDEPAVEDQPETTRKPTLLFQILTAVVLIPLSVLARFVTEVAAAPDFAPDTAVNYWPAMIIVATFHLLMLGGIVGSAFTFRRVPCMTWVTIMMVIGYAIGSVLLIVMGK